MLTAAPAPQDIYCRIYSTTNTYAYNKTAVAFDLKYPPMYINYTVKPSNVTYKDVIDRKITGQGEEEITVDKYSPLSWFEVTVRSKTTPDKIYLQDGFGEAKGYTLYLNRTLKIVNRDDMQIEFYGNNITATASVWVKPEGNFNDTIAIQYDHRLCLFRVKSQRCLCYRNANNYCNTNVSDRNLHNQVNIN